MDLKVHFGVLFTIFLHSVLGQVYLAKNQAQATKMGSMLYYKAPSKDAPKVSTVEPSTEPSAEGQYYMAENYYADYKAIEGPPKYQPEYGPTSEGPASISEVSTASPTPSSPADIQGHLDALLKLLLTSKTNSPKFLLLLPLMGKGAKPSPPAAAPSPTTVKPRPRKKTKYIVVN